MIINFLPVTDGGGLQNAVSFLDTFLNDPQQRCKTEIVVKRGGELERRCEERGFACIAVGESFASRLAFEAAARFRFQRGQLCFTQFGPPMLGLIGHTVNVSGIAYSNLFYPEIPFWDPLPCGLRLRQEAIDECRRRAVAGADYWIFETEVLAKRAVSICGFPKDRIGVVPMAVSCVVSQEQVLPEAERDFAARIPKGFRFLFLSGPNSNKRLHLVPPLAANLRQLGVDNAVFVTTLGEGSGYLARVREGFSKIGLLESHIDLGLVRPGAVSSLIAACDAMCNFSRLESFSNNFVEAWAMRVPLIVTDADWARSACGAGAAYVDPTEPSATAAVLSMIVKEPSCRASIVERGREQLRRYPSANEKNDLYFQHLATASKLGSCPSSLRRAIRWPRNGEHARHVPIVEQS